MAAGVGEAQRRICRTSVASVAFVASTASVSRVLHGLRADIGLTPASLVVSLTGKYVDTLTPGMMTLGNTLTPGMMTLGGSC